MHRKDAMKARAWWSSLVGSSVFLAGSLLVPVHTLAAVGPASPQWAPSFWEATASGAVYGPTFHGPLPHLNRSIVGMASTPDGAGYWLVGADGGVFSFGDATFHGSLGNVDLNQPIVGMASTPDGAGYWLVGADGGVFSFGDAIFHGSLGNVDLNQPIVGMASTPDGAGYWLVGADGGVFSFGDATFHGSLADFPLMGAIVGITATRSGAGYWLDGSDGGVFAFGDAGYFGATPEVAGSIVGPLMPTPDSQGYWLAPKNQRECQAFGDAYSCLTASSNLGPGDSPYVYPPAVASAAVGDYALNLSH
jgi:hypothetical protein